jgi:hypothetical protein
MTNTSRIARLFVFFFACLVCASNANAQAHYGLRAGVSGDPDQFVVGGHIETKPLIPHLSFRPNLEVGFGDSSTLVAANIEFAYRIDLDRKPWWIYVGAGPAAVWTHHDQGDTDFGGGFNILVGVQHKKGLFAEFKVGMIDSPDVKFMVGHAFK